MEKHAKTICKCPKCGREFTTKAWVSRHQKKCCGVYIPRNELTAWLTTLLKKSSLEAIVSRYSEWERFFRTKQYYEDVLGRLVAHNSENLDDSVLSQKAKEQQKIKIDRAHMQNEFISAGIAANKR